MALAFTLIVPAGYFAIAYAELNHELSFSANLKANRLARYIYANQQLWQYQTHRLSQLIEVPEADESEMRQRIFDAEGKVVFEAGAEPSQPVATARVPLVISAMTVGSIETAASMRGLIMATALVGLLSGLLGFAAFFVLRVVPLRIIDSTLAELDTIHDVVGALKDMPEEELKCVVLERLYMWHAMKDGPPRCHRTKWLALDDADES